ncbi:protodermal factor 1.3 [Genlisea aurea]|uniref:Protodermal factor 1.3 n=1 Tax=Genlisea aurea TaxID=192259 RepID=S8CMM6_9LAMI|nr:protodermal factor 1.3 [Genlisea aurea]
MEIIRRKQLLLLPLFVVVFCHNSGVTHGGVEDEKNFFHYPFAPVPPIVNIPPVVPNPNPPAVSYPPKVSGTPPAIVGGGHATPRSKPPTICESPPAHKSIGTYHRSSPIAVKPPAYQTPTVVPHTPSPPPLGLNPNSPPFPFVFWRNNPQLVWRLVGWWGGTLGNAFGISQFPGFGSHANVLQALSNDRNDGYGELYREGTAGLLNAMARTRYAYSVNEVRDNFVAALASDAAAATQAQLFKVANEGLKV